MQKMRCYVDTSVWRGVTELHRKFKALMFFNMVIKTQSICLYSKIVEKELKNAPHLAEQFLKLFWSDKKEKLGITPEVRSLADTYVKEGIVGEKNYNDCLHIAAASVYRADMIVSWNFKHIVNAGKIGNYNEINAKFGYPKLNIFSPEEAVERYE